MSNEFIYFYRPWIGDEEEREVLSCLRSGWLTTGPKTKAFEEMFKECTRSKHAIAVSSGTAAIHLALLASGIKEGDEVITTPFTFAATGNEILHAGAKPVFVDVDKKTMNIDVEKIKEKITKKTRAILPVHMSGRTCDMDEILNIADKNQLFVIEDAAHALAAKYKNKPVGSIGHFTCFSFYATKNITTGEGGMLTTDNEEFAEKIRIMSLHGMTRDAWKRYGKEAVEEYQIVSQGFKYNLSDLQSTIGIQQLKKMPFFQERRKRLWDLYNKGLSAMSELSVPAEISEQGTEHARHLYMVKLNLKKLKLNRDEISKELRARGIGTSVHFRSLHMHPYYKKMFGYKVNDFPVAAELTKSVLSLPLYPRMEDADVKRVVRAVKDVVFQSLKRNQISLARRNAKCLIRQKALLRFS